MRNRAHLEASIAEGYIAEECLIFYSRYLEFVEIVFNRPIRNVDDTIGAMSNIQLDSTEWVQSHRYVLFNSNEIIPFRE